MECYVWECCRFSGFLLLTFFFFGCNAFPFFLFCLLQSAAQVEEQRAAQQEAPVGSASLAGKYSDITAQFDVDKNADLNVWWKCPECRSSWQSTIRRRTIGSSCPHCACK
jgi:hypothetical protein